MSGRAVRRGFTLIEAVATMVVLSTVSAVLSGVVWAGVRSFDEGAESARLHNECSVAMERMVRELRSVPIGETGTPDITSVGPSSIVWDGGSRSLELTGGELTLTVDGVSGVLLRDVASFSIAAFDGTNSELAGTLSGTAVEPVRRLALEVSASRGRASGSVRTRVFLRCMMLEGAS